MSNEIRCETCNLMLISGRAERTAKNVHLSGPRGKCFCQHQDAEAAASLVCSGSSRIPGFIAFTKGGSNRPNVKTAPTWCPRKLAIQPKEISKLEAYKIVDTKRPHGLFFLKEGCRYTGIDNRTEVVLVEEFDTKAACLKWLIRKMDF